MVLCSQCRQVIGTESSIAIFLITEHGEEVGHDFCSNSCLTAYLFNPMRVSATDNNVILRPFGSVVKDSNIATGLNLNARLKDITRG